MFAFYIRLANLNLFQTYMALPVPKLPVPVPNLVFLAMYDGLGAVLV